MFACLPNQHSETQLSLQLNDSLSFPTGFSFEDRPSGRFYNKEANETYFYFGNVATNKALKIFSQDAQLVQTVNLKELLSKSAIEDIDVWSIDTILALSKYNGRLFFLNRYGIVWKEINLLEQLPNDEPFNYEIGSSYFSKMNIDKNTLVFCLNAIVDSSKENNLENFTLTTWKASQFVLYENIYSDTISSRTSFKMYQEIFPRDSFALNLEVKSFLITDETLFAHSFYSNQLFQLRGSDLQLIKTHKIESKYNHDAIAPISVFNRVEEVVFKEMMQASNNTIARHFYNEYKKHHYFVVSIDKEHWSLLICSNKMKKLGEVKMTNLYTSFILPSKNGLLLEKEITVENYDQLKILFHEFTY